MRPYTKKELEVLLYRQLENIELLNERISLLQEQNTIYRDLNRKLMEEVVNGKQSVQPYPKAGRPGKKA